MSLSSVGRKRTIEGRGKEREGEMRLGPVMSKGCGRGIISFSASRSSMYAAAR